MPSMKSFRMKIAAGSSPPDSVSTTPRWVSTRLSRVASSKIGTMAAVPVTTDDSSNRTYSRASLPGTRTRDSAYAASAASTTTSAALAAAWSTELPSELSTYGLSSSALKLSRVNAGTDAVIAGWASNGAVASHSSGSAKNPATSARNVARPIAATAWRARSPATVTAGVPAAPRSRTLTPPPPCVRGAGAGTPAPARG